MLWSCALILMSCALCFDLCTLYFDLHPAILLTYSRVPEIESTTKHQVQSTKHKERESQSVHLFRCFRNQKLRRHNHWNIKTRGSVEKSNASLPANVCQVSEVPCNQIVDFMV